MAATQNGTTGLPSNPPTTTKEWSYGLGETQSKEWRGAPADIDAKYESLKGDLNIGKVTQSNADGRARVVAQFGRSNNGTENYGDDVTEIEELYAIDIVKDIYTAPYWTTATATKLTDDQVAWVRECSEGNYSEAKITLQAAAYTPPNIAWANWTNSMKELRHHVLDGETSYLLTGFILRVSLYGVRTSFIGATFSNINEVATSAPTLSAYMLSLVDQLPSGEWLYKPPQVEHLGGGRWRVVREWHWADKWSKIYGGTWGL